MALEHVDPDAWEKKLADYRTKSEEHRKYFAEQYELLQSKLADLHSRIESIRIESCEREASPARKEADAKLKALQEYVRNLPKSA